ncbi:FIST signal transduction protein [Mucilaginibacter pedocola]|uniref:Histidine kinase n=1 Tax=Mucilaginibacter pedocola TaxID=1792845 RepID=A0A1S9P6X9_9SPHI|nr:FIST N-terminal domain-containing protein [Mucilaginibacter pedocola]OOQ56713.1 histidine kinase [Mucilaginibacter pedocola]
MKVAQQLYKDGRFIESSGVVSNNSTSLLVLAFGDKNLLLTDGIHNKLLTVYPNANIVTCSTSGEIYDSAVSDGTVSVVALEFEKTAIKAVNVNVNDFPNSYDVGKKLFNNLNTAGLAYVLLISDGGLVNGSQLVKGIEDVNINKIPVTGGLAGDADKFNYTLVGLNQAPAVGNVVAVGFYGDALEIGHGSLGGWEIFGPEKIVTRSRENHLYEIDGKSALGLYKQYLGRYADDLPGSALLFPLYVRSAGTDNSVVRTILSIDNAEQSMTFAGDIPEGSYIRFMKANFDKLIDAATTAAVNTAGQLRSIKHGNPQFALLISCVGRKLILGKRIDEEVEAIKEIFGPETLLGGFYSYGEISPLQQNGQCQLHNQTMTITTFNEDIPPHELS